MKKFTYRITILIVLICLVIVVTSLNIALSHRKLAEGNNEIVDNLKSNILLNTNYNGGYYSFDEEFLLLNEDGDYVKMDSVINESCLILYIDKSSCSSCIADKISRFLAVTKEKLPNMRRIVFMGGRSVREMNKFKLENRLDCSLYSLNKAHSQFLYNISKTAVPFAFYIDTSLTVSNVFILSKGVDNLLSSEYCVTISEMVKRTKVFRAIENKSDNPILGFEVFPEKQILHDTLLQRQIINSQFEIRNLNDKPIGITSYSTSCPCVKVSFDNDLIFPDSTRVISVEILTKEKGVFEQRINIYTDLEVNNDIELYIDYIVN